MEVWITSECYIQLFNSIKHSTKEVCFLLGGDILKGNYYIKEVAEIFNQAKSKFFFIITNEDFIEIKQKINYTYCGIFHSHSNNSDLSPQEVKFLKKEKILWIIGHVRESKLVFKSYLHYKNEIHDIRTCVIKSESSSNLTKLPAANMVLPQAGGDVLN